MRLTLTQALIAVGASAAVILATRVISFLVFSGKKPPTFIRFIERYIPAVILSILLVYCFKDVNFNESPFGAPYIICTVIAAVLHIVFNNSMLSILGSTALFMILSRIM